MNDWDNRTFFWTFQAIQFVFLAVVCLDLIGYYVPIAREALAFLYLTFLPGGVLVLKRSGSTISAQSRRCSTPPG